MPITLPSAAVRAGTVAHFAADTPPVGWLVCNGAAVNRAIFGALFAAISTTYGAGDGSTTFNLPDLRGEFLRGLDQGRGADVGRTIGTAQGSQMQSHLHQQRGEGWNVAYGGDPSVSPAAAPGSGILRLTSTTTANTGGTTNSSENRPRNIAMLACIRF